jgi:hypothetical protein
MDARPAAAALTIAKSNILFESHCLRKNTGSQAHALRTRRNLAGMTRLACVEISWGRNFHEHFGRCHRIRRQHGVFQPVDVRKRLCSITLCDAGNVHLRANGG